MCKFCGMSPKFAYKMRVPEVFLKPLGEKLKEYPGCARRREKYYFVLHLVARELKEIYHEYAVMGRKVDATVWHCNLYSVYLHNAIGNDYNGVIEDLVNWGFICRSQGYLVGNSGMRGRSKAFWFGWEYRNYWFTYCTTRNRRNSDRTGETRAYGRTRSFQVKSRRFLERLEGCAAEVKTAQMLDPTVRACHEELKHFSIDRGEAIKVLDRLVRKGEISETRRKKELAKVDRFNSAAESPTALFVKKDRFGRIHTNITQLKREVRSSCLYCDGERTVGIDIKSSQGAFLSAIFHAVADGCMMLEMRESPSMKELRSKCRIRDREKYVSELDRYDTLLRGGQLYEFFQSELSQDFDLDREVTRDEAKTAFLSMLFGPVHFDENKDEMRGAVHRVWLEHFPSLLEVIEQMKEGNYAALAQEMQRVESDFVFNTFIPAIRWSLTECHYCTVHDSVIVPERFGQQVRALGDNAIDDVGIPTMTKEEFGMVVKGDDERAFEEEVSLEMRGLLDLDYSA